MGQVFCASGEGMFRRGIGVKRHSAIRAAFISIDRSQVGGGILAPS
jgi:hypothetical protein